MKNLILTVCVAFIYIATNTTPAFSQAGTTNPANGGIDTWTSLEDGIKMLSSADSVKLNYYPHTFLTNRAKYWTSVSPSKKTYTAGDVLAVYQDPERVRVSTYQQWYDLTKTKPINYAYDIKTGQFRVDTKEEHYHASGNLLLALPEPGVIFADWKEGCLNPNDGVYYTSEVAKKTTGTEKVGNDGYSTYPGDITNTNTITVPASSVNNNYYYGQQSYQQPMYQQSYQPSYGGGGYCNHGYSYQSCYDQYCYNYGLSFGFSFSMSAGYSSGYGYESGGCCGGHEESGGYYYDEGDEYYYSYTDNSINNSFNTETTTTTTTTGRPFIFGHKPVPTDSVPDVTNGDGGTPDSSGVPDVTNGLAAGPGTDLTQDWELVREGQEIQQFDFQKDLVTASNVQSADVNTPLQGFDISKDLNIAVANATPTSIANTGIENFSIADDLGGATAYVNDQTPNGNGIFIEKFDVSTLIEGNTSTTNAVTTGQTGGVNTIQQFNVEEVLAYNSANGTPSGVAITGQNSGVNTIQPFSVEEVFASNVSYNGTQIGNGNGYGNVSYTGASNQTGNPNFQTNYNGQQQGYQTPVNNGVAYNGGNNGNTNFPAYNQQNNTLASNGTLATGNNTTGFNTGYNGGYVIPQQPTVAVNNNTNTGFVRNNVNTNVGTYVQPAAVQQNIAPSFGYSGKTGIKGNANNNGGKGGSGKSGTRPTKSSFGN